MTYKITNVIGPRPWTHKQSKSELHDFILTLEGQEKQAILTQRPSTAPPKEGDQIDLELKPHDRFPDKLRASKPDKGGFGGKGGGKSVEEQKRIAMQASQKVAIDVARLAIEGLEVKPDSEQITTVVKRVAAELFEQIEGVAK